MHIRVEFLFISFIVSTLFTSKALCEIKGSITDSLRNQLFLDVFNAKPKANVVISTLALRFSLCKLASVAQGPAKVELLSALGMPREDLLAHCYTGLTDILNGLKQADLILLNKIYVNYTSDVDPTFIANSSIKYGVDVEKIGFNLPRAAVSFINRRFETETYKRIPDIVSQKDIDKNTTMIILSAAHFKITWEFPFDIRLTKYANFRHINNKISSVPMMTKYVECFYFNDFIEEYKALTIKLGSFGASVTFIVPDNTQGLLDFLNQLSKNKNLLKKLRQNMKWTYLKISLPRFKIKTYVDWTEFLKQIGLKNIFDRNGSGLKQILRNKSETLSFYVNKAKQKIFIDIDEMGPYRQEKGMEPIWPNPQMNNDFNKEEFIADRPFFFTVNLDAHGNSHELFTGVYYGPEQ